MTVYIEYAIIDNLVIDYLLLKASLKLLRLKISRLRLIAAALVGTVFAVIFPLFKVTGAVAIILKIFLGEIMVLIAADHKSIFGFIKNFILFCILTFVSGGAIYGLCYIFNFDFSVADGVLQLSTQADICFGAIIIVVYLILKSAVYIFSASKRANDAAQFERTVSVFDGGETVRLSAIVDTGNRLYDGKSGKPVSIMCKTAADKLILNGTFKLKEAHYTEYSTIKGRGKILVFEIDRLVIYCGESRNIIDNAMIGVSPTPVADGADIILHYGLLAGEV